MQRNALVFFFMFTQMLVCAYTLLRINPREPYLVTIHETSNKQVNKQEYCKQWSLLLAAF